MCDPITNPHCFQTTPTDYSSWIFLSGTPSGATGPTGATGASGPSGVLTSGWRQCSIFSPDVTYFKGDCVRNGTAFYLCQNSECKSLNSFFQIDKGITCDQQFPDPISGKCEASTNPKCINPCIRLPNGQLVVNKDTSQCRVFTTTSDGFGGLSQPCPTVCPQSCVEMWETCPPGTGIISTLSTNTPNDLYSLTSPVLLDSKTNKIWPASYAGTPYNECYSYNTRFCDMPMARQVTFTKDPNTKEPLAEPLTLCYANCPQGTFPSQYDNTICLFNPTDPNFTNPNEAYEVPGKGGPDTDVQRVFCNPLYYNESFWGGDDIVSQTLNPTNKLPGKQKGCSVIALPSKQNSTCPLGTSSYLNEYFNLEWCLPECKSGYTLDLTQTTCIATCEGSMPNNSMFNVFLDYVDFYIMSGRCKDEFGIEVNCAQNNVPGRCPVQENDSQYSSQFGVNTELSENKWAASSLNPNSTSPSGYGDSQGLFIQNLQNYQNNYASNQDLINCPDGMVRGNPANQELENLCYDTCMDGYEASYICSNGAANCESPQYICKAKCPGPSEGLGAWTSSEENNIGICTYKYPNNKIPSDPNMLVSCPEDGRFLTQQVVNSNSVTNNVCVKATYLRNVTCPSGYIQNTKNDCVLGCNSSDSILLVNGQIVCQSEVLDNSKHDVDMIAVADRDRAAKNFKNRVLSRKSYGRGQGSDPGEGVGITNTNRIASYATVGALVLLGSYAAFHFIKKK